MSIFNRKRSERRSSRRSIRATERAQELAERRRQEEERRRRQETRRVDTAARRGSKTTPRASATTKPSASPTPSATTKPAPVAASASASATASATAAESVTAPATAEPSVTAEPTVAVEPTEQPDPVAVPESEVHHRYQSQVDFSSDQLEVVNPVTDFLQTPAVAAEFDFHSRDLVLDDGAKFEMWSFEDDQFERGFPGPTLRVQEGRVFHATVHPSKGPHTIHWHGMEPDPRNDGVGHTSFEVDGQYTYQMQPEAGRPGDPNYGAAGTYFYHCHVNTPLHVQMGMFGPLVIDPVVHPDFPVSPGARRAFVDGPEYDIDTEALFAPYCVDPRWHEMNHADGLSGEDVGMNRFEPRHFYLLGGELARRPAGKELVWSLSSLRANVTGGPKKPTLLRTVNANYLPNMVTFTDASGAEARIAEIISHDGRPYRDTSVPGVPAPCCSDAGFPLMTSRLAYGAAERYDLLLHPPAPGRYYLNVEWHDWITGAVVGKRTIPIDAT